VRAMRPCAAILCTSFDDKPPDCCDQREARAIWSWAAAIASASLAALPYNSAKVRQCEAV